MRHHLCWVNDWDCFGRASWYIIAGHRVLLCKHHARQYQTGRYDIRFLVMRMGI